MYRDDNEATNDSEQYRGPRRYRSDRMLALSDGVFAFAITLLVLDLVVPTLGDGGDIIEALLSGWPGYLVYLISFATIGAIWLAHTAITDHLDHTNSTFIRLNLLVLLFVSFLPYPTRFLSTFIYSERPERVALALYGCAVLLLTGLLWTLWQYANRAGLFASDVPEDDRALFTQRMIPGIIVYMLLIAVGWILPVVALVGYALIALFFIFPLRFRKFRAVKLRADQAARSTD